MQRMIQKEVPLEKVVENGDFLIIEKEVDNRVVDRQCGFYYTDRQGRLVLTNFDSTIELSTLNEHGMSHNYTLPHHDLCPKLEDITHYYRIPNSEIK
ncbi:MAG: hypothetical protein KKF89_02890 [Nanoarchaeota archaeon]|nr:hypothetical protein [Nanoarchaeota archaeon]MBU1854640.1 hypothetical protein [Nanoarchaeota archaeon]